MSFKLRRIGNINFPSIQFNVYMLRILSTTPDIKVAYDEARSCLLYTSDAADDMQCVDLGGRRIIKK